MPRYDLPTPHSPMPLPAIDPFRHRLAFVRVLSLLHHAESAALEGFRLLNDPRYVQASDLFARSGARLIEDEAKHIAGIEALIEQLHPGGILPPSPEEAEFWQAWRRGDLFALPYKPAIAALLCLLSEGLGFAFLYHLAECTADPTFKATLQANVEDEKMHLRLSLTVLRRALETQPRGLLIDIVVHLLGYALIARHPLRTQRRVIEDLGLPFEALFASSLRFVYDLMHLVVAETGQATPAWRALGRVIYGLFEQPARVNTLLLGAWLPEPPGLRRVLRGWGVWQLWRAGIEVTPVGQLAAA